MATKYLSPAEYAAHYRVSEYTVRRLLREGSLPGVKIGASWRIKDDAQTERRSKPTHSGPRVHLPRRW